eukprot:4104981-Prymnesium_polylepis.1
MGHRGPCGGLRPDARPVATACALLVRVRCMTSTHTFFTPAAAQRNARPRPRRLDILITA